MTPSLKIKLLSTLVKNSEISDSLFKLCTLFLLYENLEIAKFTQEEFATLLGKSIPSVRRTLREGERYALIYRHRYAQGKNNGYSLNIAKLKEEYKYEISKTLSHSR